MSDQSDPPARASSYLPVPGPTDQTAGTSGEPAATGAYQELSAGVGSAQPATMAPVGIERNVAASRAHHAGGFGHSKRRWMIELVAIVGGLALLLWGGLALARTSAGFLVRFVPVSVDAQIGNIVAAAMGGQACDDPAAQAYVQDVLDRLLAVAPKHDFEFKISVADSDMVNAFAAPGGVVVIHRGLLEKAGSGDEVAAVVAHEIQHVLGRHGMKSLLRSLSGSLLLGTLFGYADIDAIASVTVELSQRAYSRDHERDADEQGRALMKAVGANPGALATFFERLQNEPSASIPPLLSTHPGHDERIARAKADAAAFTPTYAFAAPPTITCP